MIEYKLKEVLLKYPRACPFCNQSPKISDQYILSDKPAWDMGCENYDCKVRPRLTEQRNRERMIEVWNGWRECE
jgi:hypothetical protein